MRVWTFQRTMVAATVIEGRVHTQQWSAVDRADRLPFLAMARAMHDAGVHCPFPPVWCWPGEPLEATVIDVGRNLLSAHQIETGLCVLELEVPNEQAFQSNYCLWQQFYLGASQHSEWLSQSAEPPEPHGPAVQITLAHILPEWVVTVADLPGPLHEA